MSNPILDSLGQRNNGNSNQPSNNQLIQQINNMMSQMKLAADPQKMFEQVVLRNPNAAQVAQLIRQNGNDPKKAFYSYANQLGLNPNSILASLMK